MKIYQGEPLSFKLNAKDDEGAYIPSFEGLTFEALLKNTYGKKVRAWSTEDGTIKLGTETIGEATAAYASFFMDGSATAELGVGKYTLEVAKVLSNGRAIGVACEIVNVCEALIRDGV